MDRKIRGWSEWEANQKADSRVDEFLGALDDLRDYGTAWANKAGGLTIPAPARAELGILDESSHWHVMGSPLLGIATSKLPARLRQEETLGFLLKGNLKPLDFDSRPVGR